MPSKRTESGYRLYTNADLLKLEPILVLKMLGLSLDEIKACLEAGPASLDGILAQQRAMLTEKRARLDAVLRAIDKALATTDSGERRWEDITRVVLLMQMSDDKEWVKKHLTDEQRRRMEELSASSYSDSARQKLSERAEWTEQDQVRAQEQWAHVAAEARRLSAAGADPACPEAQAIAKVKADLLHTFTQGYPEIEAGLQRFYEQANALPADQKPYDFALYDPGKEGSELLDRAMEILRERQRAEKGE